LPTPTTLPQSSRYSYPADAESIRRTFRILTDLDSLEALPIAHPAVGVGGSIGDITWDPSRAEALIDGGVERGMEYTVHSKIVIPTPGQLDLVDRLAPQAYGKWIQLPADLDPRFEEIAARWTADVTSNYRKVLAIQQRLHAPSFTYSEGVDTGVDADGLIEFLTRTRAGFCQHYAAAMTVLVRALGLPARIAVGFRPGTLQEDGSYLVRSTDAHSWVEVLFAGYGWLPFEPEPPHGPGTIHPNAHAGRYLEPTGVR
jgi:transglutaminase-like putative cysteine protease